MPETKQEYKIPLGNALVPAENAKSRWEIALYQQKM